MAKGKRTSPEMQLKIARRLLAGDNCAAIAADLGIAKGTVTRWRAALLKGLAEAGVTVVCGCGREVGHRGVCKVDREMPPDAPELTDEQILSAIKGDAIRPPRTEADSKREFVRSLGRCHGWGESEESMRRRLGIGQLEIARLKREHPTAWNEGLAEGRERLMSAKGQAPTRAASPPTQPAPTAPVEGLTPHEERVLELLAEAWNLFRRQPQHGTADVAEFTAAIHRAQSIVAVRVARRLDPKVWRQP